MTPEPDPPKHVPRLSPVLSRDDAKHYLWEINREAEIVEDCYHNRFVPAATRWLETSARPEVDSQEIIDREQCEKDMLAALEGILSGYARISLFFFPETRSKMFGRGRAAQLRSMIGIDTDHPLGNRKLRNHWMHLDERLDSEVQAGRPVPLGWLVNSRHKISEGLWAETFRLIDPGAETVYILGEAFRLRELVDAVDHVSGLAACAIVDS
jgi:hypothetical protein